MIYQVTATIFFEEEDEAKDFYHDCEKAIVKGVDINTDKPNTETSFIELVENHHDESPTSPCTVISSLP